MLFWLPNSQRLHAPHKATWKKLPTNHTAITITTSLPQRAYKFRIHCVIALNLNCTKSTIDQSKRVTNVSRIQKIDSVEKLERDIVSYVVHMALSFFSESFVFLPLTFFLLYITIVYRIERNSENRQRQIISKYLVSI